MWCWRRLWESPGLQSILKEISPGCSLEGLMLKLKLQYFGHLMWKTDSLEKTLMLGRIGVRRRRGWHRMRWLDGITTGWTWVWVNSGSWWWTGRPGVLRFMGSQRVGHDWATELNWTLGGGGHRPASHPLSYTDLPSPQLWPHHSPRDTCPHLPLLLRITWLVEWVWESLYYPVSSPPAFSPEVLLYFALPWLSSLTPSRTHTGKCSVFTPFFSFFF